MNCDGTCVHYSYMEYECRICVRCGMNFLACPICRPSYCPGCRVEDTRVEDSRVHKLDEPYYRARGKEHRRLGEWRRRQVCND